MSSCLWVWLVAACFNVASSASCDDTSYREHVSAQLQQLAQSKGYTITEGFLSIDFNSSYTVANPNSAYGVYVFPQDQERKSYEWKLFASDAVVFAGCTMPSGRFFAFQHYVNDRYVDNKATELFADLGSTVNDLRINTSSSDSTAFDALATVVLTGDAVTAGDISAVLDAATLNILSIPDKYVYFAPGANSTVDTFSMLYRMALWRNASEFAEYVDAVNESTVWRLSLKAQNSNPRRAYDPFVPSARCSYSEVSVYNATLDEFATELSGYIEATYGYSLKLRVPLRPEVTYGFSCIDKGRDCLGETRDDLRMFYIINI